MKLAFYTASAGGFQQHRYDSKVFQFCKSFIPAAARHSWYIPATSTSLAVTAPNESSLSGARLGQLATSSGLGPEGLIDEAQAVSRQAAHGIIRDMARFIDISNQTFNRLTVIRPDGHDQWRSQIWECVCICGNKTRLTGTAIRTNKVKSCGCLQVEASTSHGMTGTPEYRSWVGMNARCYTLTNKRYPLYGGRGIGVCQRWRDSFEAFLADMGPRPSAGYSIDRIDNNGNYEPTNCRWATQQQQCNNRRTNVRYTAHGLTMTIAEWSRHLGIGIMTIRKRLIYGFSHDKVFSDKNVRYGSILRTKKEPC